MVMTKKGDFVNLLFTGYLDGKVFDSNVEEDIKQLNPEAKPEKSIVIIGEKMVVPGLDKALEDKEINKEYNIDLPYKEAFGERKRELIKTIPLNVFTKQKINPYPGQILTMDNSVARIITISGARVMTDFNNPLAGKDISYKFTITKIITDEKEKVESFFEAFAKTKPKVEIQPEKVVIKGKKELEQITTILGDKFKEIFNKTLEFQEEKEEKKEENKQQSQQKDTA